MADIFGPLKLSLNIVATTTERVKPAVIHSPTASYVLLRHCTRSPVELQPWCVNLVDFLTIEINHSSKTGVRSQFWIRYTPDRIPFAGNHLDRVLWLRDE